jgi:hypothetical protein
MSMSLACLRLLQQTVTYLVKKGLGRAKKGLIFLLRLGKAKKGLRRAKKGLIYLWQV